MLGVVASLALLGGTAVWAQYTLINGAVIAEGSVVVRGKPKTIQHLDGGMVEAIYVQDGDRIRAGDPIMRLDPTLLEANLSIYRARYVNAAALKARLFAEQVGSENLAFEELPEIVSTIDKTEAQVGQRAIFDARNEMMAGRKEQLLEKIEQFGNQIGGTQELIAAKEEQLGYIERELESVSKLRDRKLTRESQVLAIQRGRADLLGQLGEHRSELARIGNSIRDIELELLQLERQRREQAVTELRDTTAVMEELTQQIVTTESQLNRIEVRSPADGVVHELQVATVGGVVPPGSVVGQIIPTAEGIIFETRVDPGSIDQVYMGQPARLTLSAFNQRTTPELFGTVTAVSPDVVTDPNTGLSFYRAQLSVTDAERAKLSDLNIMPGMPIVAFLLTEDRSVLSYLIRPLTDHFREAFRED